MSRYSLCTNTYEFMKNRYVCLAQSEVFLLLCYLGIRYVPRYSSIIGLTPISELLFVCRLLGSMDASGGLSIVYRI
jgi:hypothetical protein